MGKLTIQEIAKILVERSGLSQKDANWFASEMFAIIQQRLEEDELVKIKGLGTFKIINVEARESVSVRTGERVVIDSHAKVTFTPDAVMKELVNKPFSQFETVVLNDGTYHTWWPTAPTASNQVYGVSISDGRLYRVYNNRGTYSVQAYDKTTTYQTLTQTLVDTGTETTGKLITAKIVHDSIKKWSIETLTNPDFDNITTVGIYNIQVTQSCNGAPPGLGSMGSCIMIVNAVNDDVIMSQTVFMANGRTCSRGRGGDGTWDTYWANRESRGYVEATDAHAEGDSTHATGNNAHSEGYQTRASGASSHAEGNKSEAQGGQAHAEGYNTVASGASSHSEGTNTIASNKQAHAEGFAGRAFGESSHAEGSWTVTGGVSAHAEGGATYAGGKDSHAEGYSNGYLSAELAAPVNANGSTFTFASGTSIGGHNYIAVPSIGFCSKIMSAAGPTYTTQGSVSQALPIGTLCLFISSGAVGYVSHSEGFKTFAYGSRSHAEGDSTQAIGDYSHAEGASTTASGTYSHAEGNGSTASSTYAHAEGYSTTAGGSQSHAEGYQTKATGDSSHAEGIGTEAQSAGMHVAGQYNATKSGYARVTGWGSSTTAKDIERLDTQGNLWISGYLSGATVFMITPGTTTRAAIEAAYQANRPMMLDISGINGGNQVVYVPTEVRRVYSDNTGTDFDYYFKFTYPASYNAGYHAGTMEPNGLISSYYVAVTKDNGWVKMTDVSHNGWDLVSSSTSIDVIPYAKAVYAQSADTAQTASAASSAVANSTLDTSINNKLEKDGSNVTTTWSDSNINKILKNISAGTDDVWDGDDIIASSHSNNAKSQEFTRRTTAHLKKCMYNGGTLTGKFTSTVKVDNPICIEHSSSGKDAYFYSKVGSISCGFGVGSGGTNHGIWSDPLNAWMISEQGDQRVHINGNSILVSKTAQLAPGASSIDTIEICKALGSSGGPGYLACGAIRIAGTRGYGGSTNYCSVIKKSNHFTVSMSDMANPQEGQIYFYYNTSSIKLSVTWKFNNSTTTSGDVYVGCMAQFMLVDKDNQVFARIF